MQPIGYNPPANRITFRTVYNDVEAIKAYLRRLKPIRDVHIDEDIIRDVISDYLSDMTEDVLSDRFSDFFNDMISPLRPEWISDDNGFIERIVSGVKCDCTPETIINIITTKKDDILSYISGDIYNYISDYVSDDILSLISPLRTAYVNEDFINYITANIDFDNAVEKVLADQYPELDVKYILRDYHLINKHYVEISSAVLTIPTGDLYNPASAFERFRLLAYVSSDSSINEPLTDLNMSLNDNVYQIIEPISQEVYATLNTNDTGELTLKLTSKFDYHVGEDSVLWYGFTDLVNPISTAPPNYTVMVSIDCSPNYLKLIDYDSDDKATGYMTVPYNNRKSYNSKYATNVRNQFGKNIEVVEVVPHPLLINDSERFIVIRAITDSSNKGYWQYRAANVDNIDAYHYNKKYNKSVLTFSPLESPIMYANVLKDTTPINYYIYKLDQTFTDDNVYNADIYSIDLSNFVPFTSALPDGLTTATGDNYPSFVNINSGDNKNFGLLQLYKAFNGCEDLASIDLRYIKDYITTNQDTLFSTFTSCVNLNTIFCNQQVGNLISDTYTFTDKDGNARAHSYSTALNAVVIGAA